MLKWGCFSLSYNDMYFIYHSSTPIDDRSYRLPILVSLCNYAYIGELSVLEGWLKLKSERAG